MLSSSVTGRKCASACDAVPVSKPVVDDAAAAGGALGRWRGWFCGEPPVKALTKFKRANMVDALSHVALPGQPATLGGSNRVWPMRPMAPPSLGCPPTLVSSATRCWPLTALIAPTANSTGLLTMARYALGE